eukprot:6212839-Pleurochrysis_carterae.AAC.2
MGPPIGHSASEPAAAAATTEFGTSAEMVVAALVEADDVAFSAPACPLLAASVGARERQSRCVHEKTAGCADCCVVVLVVMCPSST